MHAMQELLDAVWPGQAVHVYGASMGGFIGSKLAALLAKQVGRRPLAASRSAGAWLAAAPRARAA
jgi:hypothetical protein